MWSRFINFVATFSTDVFCQITNGMLQTNQLKYLYRCEAWQDPPKWYRAKLPSQNILIETYILKFLWWRQSCYTCFIKFKFTDNVFSVSQQYLKFHKSNKNVRYILLVTSRVGKLGSRTWIKIKWLLETVNFIFKMLYYW